MPSIWKLSGKAARHASQRARMLLFLLVVAFLGGFAVHVVGADENRVVARHTAAVVST